MNRRVERVEEKVQQVQQGTRRSAGVEQEQDVNVIWAVSHPFLNQTHCRPNKDGVTIV